MAKIKEYTIDFADFKAGEIYKKTVTMATKADTVIKFIGDTENNTYKYTENGKNCVVNIYGKVDDEDVLLAQISVKDLAKKETKYAVVVETETGQGMPIRLTEVEYTPNYKNGVWSGSWLNEKAVSKEGSDTFKLAGGNNVMEFNVLAGETGYGDDTVVSNGTYDLLQFDDAYTNTCTRSGNDIVIQSDGGETIKGSVVVKDYLKNDSKNIYVKHTSDEQNRELSEILEENKAGWALTDTSKKENATLKGSWLGEYIIGGKGNNKITTGLGEDTVFISAGKDSITVDDTGSKKVSFEKFSEITPTEEDIIGTSTLAFKKGVVLTSKNDNKASVDVDLMTSGKTTYTKSGNTLTVTQDWSTGSNKKTADLVINDFFSNTELQNAITFDTESFDTVIKKAGVQLYQVGNEKKSNTINGTKYSDNITGGNKADKINLTAVGTDSVYAKAGNDTITIAKKAEGETSGTKTLDFYKGDGKDTVVFDKDADANLRIKMSNEGIAKSVEYSKTGNNLTVTTLYEDEDAKGKTVKTTDTITINDYFKKDSLVKFSAINSQGQLTGSYVALSSKLGNNNYLIVNGQKETDKTSSFYKETVFYGSGHNDKMTYTGKGASNMLGGKGNDLYDVTLTKKTDLFISDTEGDNEVKLSETSDNIRLLFNVDKNGIVVETTKDTTNYNINQFSLFEADEFNYKNLMKNGLGQVQINNFFYTQKQTTGEGDDTHKETVVKTRSYDFYTSDSENAFDMDTYIDQVKSSVSGWIAGSKYSDKTALEIFQSGDKTAITGLIAAYNIGYTPNPEQGQG